MKYFVATTQKQKMSLVDTIHGIAYFVILNDAKFK